MAPAKQITRLVLENYKSIAGCDVRLQALTLLVGRNGAGKSNFLDSLRFVNDVLLSGFQQPIAERGGIEELMCHAPGMLRTGLRRELAVGLEMRLGDKTDVQFSFKLVSRSPGSYVLDREECTIDEHRDGHLPVHYRNEMGKVDTNVTLAAGLRLLPDRLYLQGAAGLDQFQSVYDALTHARSYRVDPAAMRIPRTFAASNELATDASNIASVLWQLQQTDRLLLDRIERYLEAIVPGLHSIEIKQIGSFLIPHFRTATDDGRRTTEFPIASMSDGTLRSLALLVALLAGVESDANRGRSLILLEEPETALHPGATRVLLDAMSEASEHSQVVVTTHSPDLLDQKDIPGDSVLAVEAEEGVTRIGPIDEVGRSAMRDRLFTAGELLRTAGLHPTGAEAPRQAEPA